MKASELRIGNLIIHSLPFGSDKIKKVTAFDLAYITENTKEEYCPIPLTEEWLLKFGFEKQHNEEDFDYWFKNDFSNDIIWEHSEGFCHNLNYGGDIKYVHQLQNLYFALTNEELTYEQQK